MAKATSSKTGFSCEAGDIFTFKTKPYWTYAAKETDRYGAFKVIGQANEVVLGGFKMAGDVTIVAVLDAMSSGKPAMPAQLSTAPVLVSKRFSHEQGAQTCFYQVDSSTFRKFLPELTLATKATVSAAEHDFLKPEKRPGHTAANALSLDAEGEWRWRHDRKAFQAEMDLREAEHVIPPKRATTTWSQLKKQKHFSGWSLMPAAFRLEARALILETAGALEKLGAAPRKSDVTAIFRELVQRLNQLDAKHDNVVETVEREDLMQVISTMAALAGHVNVVEMVDDKRTW